MLSDEVVSLSPDVVAFIPQREVNMLVVRLEATRWNRAYEDDLELETGGVTFRVLETLNGAAPEVITVRATRIADPLTRLRTPVDTWNRLPLKTGDFMILACVAGTGAAHLWNALAATQITSPAAEEVAAVRKAYAIEQFTGSAQQKSRMLAEALESNQDVLQRYAMNQLAAQTRTEREAALRLLVGAITSHRTTADNKLELGRFITGPAFLVRECKANLGNQIVIGALAAALVNDSDPGRRVRWARLLAAAVLMEFCPNAGDDNRVRSELIRSPECPPAGQVISVLSAAAGRSTGAEKEILTKVLKAWQTA